MAKLVRIGPNAGLATIVDIHRAIREGLEETQALVVDLDGVETADVSLIQLVWSAEETARTTGKDVALSGPANEVVRDVLERGGFLCDERARRFWLSAGEVV